MSVDSIHKQVPVSSTVPATELMEVDLRQYLEIVFLWWREIIVVTFGAVLVAASTVMILRVMTPPVFEASSDIIIARVVSEVNLVEAFRTSPEFLNQEVAGASARRAALVHLVNNGAIAEAVIAELGDLLSEEEQNPAALREAVTAQAPVGNDKRTISDLIRITVSANSAEKAAAIANAWARHYISYVNNLYNQVPSETFESIEEELHVARANYEAAQQALEAFIRENRLTELQDQINQKKALRTNYLEGQTAILTNMVNQNRETRLKLFNDLVSTQADSIYQVFSHQTQEQFGKLAQLYGARDLAQRQLVRAQNLSKLIVQSGDSIAPGTVLALELLKAQVYADVEGSSLLSGLTIDLGALLTEGTVVPHRDVTVLVETLESYISQLDQEIDSLSQQLVEGEGFKYVEIYNPESLAVTTISPTLTVSATQEVQSGLTASIYQRYFDLLQISGMAQLSQTEMAIDGLTETSRQIEDLTREIQDLQADLAAEESQQRILTQQRDMHWNTFTTLNNKVVELTLARKAANSEVRLGTPALPPVRPKVGIRLTMVTAAAGALGLVASIFFVLIAHLMGQRPWLSRSKLI